MADGDRTPVQSSGRKSELPPAHPEDLPYLAANTSRIAEQPRTAEAHRLDALCRELGIAADVALPLAPLAVIASAIQLDVETFLRVITVEVHAAGAQLHRHLAG